MKFIQKNKMELGDTLVPDLFILNNMKSLHANDIKVYMYLLLMLKKGAEADSDFICKELDLTSEEMRTTMEVLLAEGLIARGSRGYVVVDLKELEIDKSYTPKFDGRTRRVQPGVEEKRKAAVDAISESFFNGVMTLNWYTDIGNMFNIYAFSEEVMIALFQYCKERKALNKKYVYAVAETWYNGGVKTFEDLESFLENYDKFTKVKQKISKSLSFGRQLSKYEEVYVKKWLEEYGYDYDVIEEGLKRSTSTTNPSIKYIDAIISSWYKKGYQNVHDILDAEVEPKIEVKPVEAKKVVIDKKKSYQNYVTREYDSDEDFYDEV